MLISEGTNIRAVQAAQSEDLRRLLRDEVMVEDEASKLMKAHDGTIFVLCSSTNELRINAIHAVCKRADRNHLWQFLLARKKRHASSLTAETLAKYQSPQTIFIRTSMLPFLKKYLENRSGEDHLLIYSMWEGYKSTVPVQELVQFCKAHEIETVSLHCSGHAYYQAVKGLIWRLNPKALIPVHCDKKDRTLFETLHHHCVMLSDGERMEV